MAHLPTAAEAQSHSWSYVSLSPSPSVPSCRVLSVCREPVNSMNAQLWRELSEALQQLDHDSAAQAVIIQSTLKKGQQHSASHPAMHARWLPCCLLLLCLADCLCLLRLLCLSADIFTAGNDINE